MDWALIGVVLAVVAVLAVAASLVVLSRRARRRPPEEQATGEAPTATRERPTPTAPTKAAPTEAPPTRAPSAPPTEQPTEAAPTRPAEMPPLEVVVPVEVPVEVPEPVAGRLVRLRGRLARSQSTLGKGLLTLLSRDRLDEDAWEEIEDTLLTADVGVAATQQIVERLRVRTKVLGTATQTELRTLLTEELVAALDPDMDRSLRTATDGRPAVVLVVGVNGTGKTTTCGKLARVLAADGRTVVLGAADTFRAAAADQLETWASRVGATTVRGRDGADPASVAFDAVRRGAEEHVDTVVVDTAGRLHTKTGLMDELGKVKRVVEKQGPIDETLLVLDATTGQNGVVQARVFTEAVNVTGIVLTKLDGTAKGGIVISVQRELGVPVKLVGLGEGADDLAPFEPLTFVEALLGD